MDLEKIQSQLKSHIQQHQVLVQEMKKDPQNVEIQRKVHSLQAELTNLSQKQRHVVQELKRNIQPKPGRTTHGKMFPQNVPSCAVATSYHQAAPRVSFASQPVSNYQIHNSIIKSTTMINTTVPRLPAPLPAGLNTPRHATSNSTANVTGVNGSLPPRLITSISPTVHNVHQPEAIKPRPAFKKPVMITTGMQTVPSLKIDTTRLKPILPRPEANKPKVSLGVQTSKPTQHGNKDDPEKLNFLSTLGLITVNKCKEITSQKQERKRRTSAIFSPYSSFQFFEPEPKKQATGLGIKRGRGRPPKNGDGNLKSPTSPNPATLNGFKLGNNEAFKNDSKTSPRLSPSPSTSPKEEEEHEDYCVVCQQSGEVLMCDTCILVYHLKCLSPPLTKIPSGMWMCPKCQETCKNKEPIEWPGTLAIAHSYLKHTAAKDKEKEKLLIRKNELKLQELELQRKVNELSGAIMSQIQRRNEIVESTRKTQTKLMQFKKFIDTVQSW